MVKKVIKKKTAVKKKKATKRKPRGKYKPTKPDDARLGNKYHEKFKTPAARQKAFKKFCDHLGNGYSTKSFHDPCVENTILKMISTYPDEFETELLSMAKAKSCFVWEQLGKLGTMGKIPGFNATSYIWNTKNRLNWKDKTQFSVDPDNPPPPPPQPIVNIDLTGYTTEQLKALDEIVTKNSEPPE